MRLPHLALVGTLAIAAPEVGASVAPDGLPGDLIRSCLAELGEFSGAESDSDSREFDLNKRCPRLAEQLASSSSVGNIASLEVDATSVEGLRDLQSFAAGFDRQPASAEKFSLDFDGLDALLADVLVEESIDDSLWERFRRWLEQYAKGGESPGLDRLLQWLQELEAPPWLGDVILKASVVLIVLLALMIIGNEFRLAGVLHRLRRPREPQALAGTPAAAPKSRALSLEELRGLPPRQLAAAVLEIVTLSLADRGWLSASSSFTNGELVRQIGQRHSDLAGSFTSLVKAIENVIYGDRLPDEEARQRLLVTAAELIERSRGGPTTASARMP
ncbi:MAG: hypothetical protein BMS9Abin14_764 [Gammaproteobacteria bacterium]|nr:MAG: hypothetical protein BMS9Abin14_764 [Gammaproteobacteria bacterium]